MLRHVRDFWAEYLDLYRMDDNFSGIDYLCAHLDHPHWPEISRLLEVLDGDSIGALEREVVRRKICSIAKDNPDLHEAVFELGDDRLKWSLANLN